MQWSATVHKVSHEELRYKLFCMVQITHVNLGFLFLMKVNLIYESETDVIASLVILYRQSES